MKVNLFRNDRQGFEFDLIDLLYRLKPKGNSSIDAVGQIYLEWV
jgi:hypothetical protein